MRAKLTLSYAGFVVGAGSAVLALLAVLLWRYLPDGAVQRVSDGAFVPDRDDVLRAVLPFAAWCLVLLLVIGLGGGWVVAGWALRPLRTIGAAVLRASQGHLSHRISLPGRTDELRDLADDVDSMLARLEAAFGEQQRFAANASHELRTPLATMRTMLQVARMEPGHDASLLNRLEQTNERSIATTEALLLLADLGRRRRQVDGESDVVTIVQQLVATEIRADLPVHTRLPAAGTATVDGAPEIVTLILANLVRNAGVHNLARGGSVWVEVDVAGPRVLVRIDNTGPELPSDEMAQLTVPFARGRTRTPGSGSGLGLAIATSAADLLDAGVRLEPRPGGGLTTETAFRRAPRSSRAPRDG